MIQAVTFRAPNVVRGHVYNLWNGHKKKHPKKVTFFAEFPASWWFQPIWKNISQIGSFPQVGVKIKKYLKPPPSQVCFFLLVYSHPFQELPPSSRSKRTWGMPLWTASATSSRTTTPDQKSTHRGLAYGKIRMDQWISPTDRLQTLKKPTFNVKDFWDVGGERGSLGYLHSDMCQWSKVAFFWG